MLHLRERHRCLLRRRGRQRDARGAKLVQQLDDAGEGLGVEVMILVTAAVPGDEVRQQLSLVPEVAEGIPQRRPDIAAKSLLIGDRKPVV